MKEFEFQDTEIEGFFIAKLKVCEDARGKTTELFRTDWLKFNPAMCYFSMTKPGVSRGPHEHVDQTDYFAFVGPGDFKFTVWRKVEGSLIPKKASVIVGESNPSVIMVQPKVVHAYKNISPYAGICINLPDQLYKGEDKLQPVDEVRWENIPNHPFK